MKKHRWDDNSRYRKWVLARDRVLEDLHTRAQRETADVMREMLTHALLTAKAQYHGLKSGMPSTVDWLERGLAQNFNQAVQKLFRIAIKLRQRSYTLAKASEGEIIAQLSKGKKISVSVTRADIHSQQNRLSVAGGMLHHRIQLYVDRLRRRIASYAQAAAITAKDETDYVQDVLVAFPKVRRVRVPRRILKPKLMEAAGFRVDRNIGTEDEPASISTGFIDDQSWEDMLDAYKTDYVPQFRGPEYIADVPPGVDPDEAQYAWEFERDLTGEFVQSVRDGQIDAARDAGITDFVWIAVVDDRTDRCCLWRDGLLVSEIEKQAGDHEDYDEECNVDGDGLTPPLHFNCRCTLAPATDNMPELADDGAQEFDSWLNT